MSELNQLLLDFDHNIEFNEHDYYVSRSNYLAFNLIQNWPKWERKILNISGDTFSGKTHLAKIFQYKSNALYLAYSDINEDAFKKIKLNESIVIDDFEKIKNENLLYSLFNLIYQDNKYLLILSNKTISKINYNLDDLNSRAKNCIFAQIENPDDDLIFAIIVKSFSDRQIKLEKKLLEFIIKRIERSYGKIYEFIYKVDELSLKKKKPINLKTIKEIL
ncbi:DnaA ATPase domain-containing protein [Candidatus Pelagibacter communis]|uniref:DnaA ATPase domain-containing protein n=1 Tax=Pelagibacter ubique TaxID=198252 RepID=UPI000B0748F2|nr:DnaA/Hda family protein [Candidatus Pelagibacter ubique]